MVRGDWIKPGATVIDVGINRVPGAAGKSRIVGDVALFRSHRKLPAQSRRCPEESGDDDRMLLLNTLRAAWRRKVCRHRRCDYACQA
jgi:methylenetetrahydrofolate dehydrogenase (NADP+)/methenyltetrahydrofolate cyclohydrolase